jgi:hypothetical protein
MASSTIEAAPIYRILRRPTSRFIVAIGKEPGVTSIGLPALIANGSTEIGHGGDALLMIDR